MNAYKHAGPARARSTSLATTYPGWNIDDVEIWGLLPGPTLGDMKCDGTFDGADIEPFFLALADPGEYEAAYPDCDINNGDITGDGAADRADIEPFFELLSAGSVPFLVRSTQEGKRFCQQRVPLAARPPVHGQQAARGTLKDRSPPHLPFRVGLYSSRVSPLM